MTKKVRAAESVKVIAHERKRPARNAVGLAIPTGFMATDQLADNAFERLNDDGATDSSRALVGGLAGEPAVNHLKAAVGLLNRKRA